MNEPAAGFFGKLPCNGDFVQRRLPREFVAAWDDWLQAGMVEAQRRLGDDWLEWYLNAPLWRFVLAPGICGDSGWGGVLMPSVDRVGRYFPLTLVRELTVGGATPRYAMTNNTWFEAAESALLTALDEATTLEGFDQTVTTLPATHEVPDHAEWESRARQADWCVLPAGGDGIAGPLAGLAHEGLQQIYGNYSLWWTAGGGRFKSVALAASGLPQPVMFAFLLSGRLPGQGDLPAAGNTADLDAIGSTSGGSDTP